MRGRWLGMLLLAVLLAAVNTVGIQAANAFAAGAFEQQWKAGEAARPNFWGPLDTARDGQQEPYKEAPGGQRLVQYFDKARMELTNGAVTTGLLTVELKSGKVQLGDNTFDQKQPAQVNMAGDPGNGGPTYADLGKLSESYPNADTTPNAYVYASDHTFAVLAPDEQSKYASFDVPSGDTFVYYGDPSGRYGQFVYTPFLDFVKGLTAAGIPLDETPGYAISPVIIATVPIGGKPTTIFIQAFERRVLTYNPNNPQDFRVEFGNIGRHYYTWRYGGA